MSILSAMLTKMLGPSKAEIERREAEEKAAREEYMTMMMMQAQHDQLIDTNAERDITIDDDMDEDDLMLIEVLAAIEVLRYPSNERQIADELCRHNKQLSMASAMDLVINCVSPLMLNGHIEMDDDGCISVVNKVKPVIDKYYPNYINTRVA